MFSVSVSLDVENFVVVTSLRLRHLFSALGVRQKKKKSGTSIKGGGRRRKRRRRRRRRSLPKRFLALQTKGRGKRNKDRCVDTCNSYVVDKKNQPRLEKKKVGKSVKSDSNKNRNKKKKKKKWEHLV